MSRMSRSSTKTNWINGMSLTRRLESGLTFQPDFETLWPPPLDPSQRETRYPHTCRELRPIRPRARMSSSGYASVPYSSRAEYWASRSIFACSARADDWTSESISIYRDRPPLGSFTQQCHPHLTLCLLTGLWNPCR